MPFVDGQRFGKIQVHKIDDNVKSSKDPKSQLSTAERALLPTAREVRAERPRFDVIYARVDETPKGKVSGDSTPERVCWIYRDKLVSTPQLLKGPGYAFDIDPAQGKGLFMIRAALVEVDLASGATDEISFKNWPVRNPPSAAAYLLDGSILMYSATVAVGTRGAGGIELQRALQIKAQGLSLLEQRVMFFSAEPTLIIGYDRGVFRTLASLGVWADAPWQVSPDRFRFYVDPFHNEKLPRKSCGTFELSGVLDAWEDCFVERHQGNYPELAQKPLA